MFEFDWFFFHSVVRFPIMYTYYYQGPRTSIFYISRWILTKLEPFRKLIWGFHLKAWLKHQILYTAQPCFLCVESFSIEAVTVTVHKVIKHTSQGEQFFFGTEIKIWAGFGPVGITENKMSNFWGQFFLCFHGQFFFYFKNIVVSKP